VSGNEPAVSRVCKRIPVPRDKSRGTRGLRKPALRGGLIATVASLLDVRGQPSNEVAWARRLLASAPRSATQVTFSKPRTKTWAVP
jgi:hypothetical protein